MRLTRTLLAAGLMAAAVSLAGCHNHPGHWGDHHHHHDDGYHNGY